MASSLGEIGVLLSIIESSLVLLVVVAGTTVIFKLLDAIGGLSGFDPFDKFYLVDLALGLVFVGAGGWAMMLEFPTLGSVSLSNVDEQTLLIRPFLFLAVSGAYTLISGVFLNGLSRILLQVIHIRDRLEMYWQEIRWIYDSLLLLRSLQVWRRIKLLSESEEISRARALGRVFLFGIQLVEPSSGEVPSGLKTSDSRGGSQLRSREDILSEHQYALFTYVVVGIAGLGLLTWAHFRFGKSEEARLIIGIGALALGLLGYGIIPAYLKDYQTIRTKFDFRHPGRITVVLCIFIPTFVFISSTHLQNFQTSWALFGFLSLFINVSNFAIYLLRRPDFSIPVFKIHSNN
ncbi:hypothetical protein [Haloferax sp. ATB1]|uniref:hypothetical protein n=1 Tax=Haloferax sp. ATB1 TaxID=1508454 RepID=UPI000FE14718|nr:hypothetical protein [Haloferax sp. ATB1]